MRHEDDLPHKAPDVSLLGRHLLSAIYPSTGTLKTFEKDSVAVVCAHSATYPPSLVWSHGDTPVDTTDASGEKKNIDTHSSDAYAKFIVCYSPHPTDSG